MEYSRFRQLYNNLILRSPENNLGNEDIFKIKWLRDKIISNSRALYEPERELSLDECMIPFSGRHKWKVFMKAKPVKYGFKAYVVSEASTGYILNWHIHTGNPLADIPELTTFKIVKKLTHPFDQRGFHIYMDRYHRFYTGLRIYRYLVIKGFGVCGTVMQNRLELSSEIKDHLNTYKYYEYDFYQLGTDFLLTAWKDKNLVLVLSTIHSTTTINYERFVKCRDENNNPITKSEEVDKPLPIKEYGKFMGGVDRFDKMLYHYHFYHKNCRWYIRIFTHFLEIAILNSYVIYSRQCKKNRSSPISRNEFHYKIAKDLLKEWRLIKNITDTPKKLRGNNNKIFYSPEELLKNKSNAECEFKSLDSKVNCSICMLEEKRAQCTKICVTHNSALHYKCFEKHKKIRQRLQNYKK